MNKKERATLEAMTADRYPVVSRAEQEHTEALLKYCRDNGIETLNSLINLVEKLVDIGNPWLTKEALHHYTRIVALHTELSDINKFSEAFYHKHIVHMIPCCKKNCYDGTVL